MRWAVAALLGLGVWWSTAALAAAVQPLDLGPVSAYPGALAVSRDGRLAAHVDASGGVRVWDAVTTRPVEGLPVGQPPASSVALSADGELLVVGHPDGRVVLWQRGRAAPLREFRGHAGRILALDISADGRRLASGSEDGTTQLFDLQTARRLQVLDSVYSGHPGEGVAVPVAVAFAAQGRLLLTHDWQRRHYDVGRVTSLWDAEQGVELATQEVAPPNGDEALQSGQALGAGGWLLAYTGQKQLMAQRLDGCSAARPIAPAVEEPAAAGRYADAVVVDPLGRWVATTHGADAKFFAAAGGRAGISLPLPGRALALAPLADGRSLLAVLDTAAASGSGMTLLRADAPAPKPARLYRIAVPAALLALPALQVAADAQPCAVSDAVRRRQQFSIPEGLVPLAVAQKLTPNLPPPPGAEPRPLGAVQRLHFNGQGQLLALYSDRGDTRPGVNVWSLSSGRTVLARDIARQSESQPLWLGVDWVVVDTQNHLVRAITGQRLLASIHGDGWLDAQVTADPETGRLYRIAGAGVEQVAADGQRLPSVRARGAIAALSARNGRLLVIYRNGGVELFGGSPLASVLFRPARPRAPDADDERWVQLMLSADGRFAQATIDASNSETWPYDLAWRLADGKPLGSGIALAELPRGANRVAAADLRAHRLAVWDLDREEAVARLPRHRSRDAQGNAVLLQTALSDDGRRVASASPDGLVRIWDIDTHLLLGEARVGAEVTALAFDAAGRQLAVGRAGGQVWVLVVP
ncbi:WD40 repeat domain-containing protein [Roseateles sp. NT4]|uniref:WD40 repeat domain-containing protein n=1 Tax=Roseateles sp. NT4 TaxID=3453715 RepID=UPI003EEF427B